MSKVEWSQKGERWEEHHADIADLDPEASAKLIENLVKDHEK